MKIAFAGTPDFAATVLRKLDASDHEVGLVISQPDARKGRGRRARPTPVAELARTLALSLRQPTRISEISDEILEHDALVVAAYGQLLRPDTLYAAREGAWNVHASLLPKYRGAAPIERAIMNGERKSGVTIIQMDEGLDTGPMALQHPVAVLPDTTGGELSELLAHLGAEAIVEVLDQIDAGTVNLIEQDSLHATYAPKLEDKDLIIGWHRDVVEVANLVRALTPRVGARTFYPGVEGPVKIWRSRIFGADVPTLEAGAIRAENGRILVGCGSGVLEVLELQMPGGKRLTAQDFLRGNVLDGAFDR